VHQEICETKTIKWWEPNTLLRLGNLKCQAVLVGVRSVLIQRPGCLVGSVWGNQHLCMQRQHSSQATFTLGNTPNLNIGSYTKRNPYSIKRFMRLAGMQLAEVVCIICFLQWDLQFCKIFMGTWPKKGETNLFYFWL